MLHTILKYGLFTGALIISAMILGFALGSGTGQFAQWLGYLIMLAALTLLFIGVKRYRDETLGGVISFANAFGLGVGISVVACIIYVIGWEINLYLTDYAFMTDYADAAIRAKTEAGANAEDIAKLTAEMDQLKANYANPLYRVGLTFIELFPVAILVSIISAALLRNSKFMPARK